MAKNNNSKINKYMKQKGYFDITELTHDDLMIVDIKYKQSQLKKLKDRDLKPYIKPIINTDDLDEEKIFGDIYNRDIFEFKDERKETMNDEELKESYDNTTTFKERDLDVVYGDDPAKKMKSSESVTEKINGKTEVLTPEQKNEKSELILKIRNSVKRQGFNNAFKEEYLNSITLNEVKDIEEYTEYMKSFNSFQKSTFYQAVEFDITIDVKNHFDDVYVQKQRVINDRENKKTNADNGYESVFNKNRREGIVSELDEATIGKKQLSELKDMKQSQKLDYEDITKEKKKLQRELNDLNQRINLLNLEEKETQYKHNDKITVLRKEITDIELNHNVIRQSNQKITSQDDLKLIQEKTALISELEKEYKITSSMVKKSNALDKERIDVKARLDELNIKEKILLENNKLITKVERDKRWRETMIVQIEAKVVFETKKLNGDYKAFIKKIRNNEVSTEDIKVYVNKLDEDIKKLKEERKKNLDKYWGKSKEVRMKNINEVKSLSTEIGSKMSQEMSQALSLK